MKKFITALPKQVPKTLNYKAVGNPKLEMMDNKISYPILAAVNGYLEKGDEYQIITIVEDTDEGRKNLENFKDQLESICETKGASYIEPEPIWIVNNYEVSYLASVFLKIIEHVDDDDELFACITYETKLVAMMIRMAVQYAYRVKKNVSMECLLYGFNDWQNKNPNKVGYVYDETALVQLDELVNLLVEQGVKNPEAGPFLSSSCPK